MSEANQNSGSSALAQTPKPPYVAVIFTSIRTDTEPELYAATSKRMDELAAAQPGFLGVESVRDDAGVGVTISYWESNDAARAWAQNLEHQEAQQAGRERWYQAYSVRVCEVQREYGMPARGDGHDA